MSSDSSAVSSLSVAPLPSVLSSSGSTATDTTSTSTFLVPVVLPTPSQSVALTTDTAIITSQFLTTAIATGSETYVSTSVSSPTPQSVYSTSPQTPSTSTNSAATPLQTTETTSINALSFALSTSTSDIASTAASTSSALSTSLISSPPLSPTQRRTILAASLSAAFLFLLSLLLATVFIYRRRRKNRYDFLDALTAPVQKEHSRACLLAGEDMDEVAATASPGIGSFGDDIFGRVINGRHRAISGGTGMGPGSYQDIAYIPSSTTTPWDTSRDPRSSVEALHHPSRFQPSEATQYMSQYLSRRAEMENEQAVGMGSSTVVESDNTPELEREIYRVQSLEDPTRSASEVDLSVIVGSVMGNKSHHFPGTPPESQQRGWSPVPSHSTCSAADPFSFASGNASGDWERHARNISRTSVGHVPLIPPLPSLSPLAPTPMGAVTHLIPKTTLRVANPAKSSPLRRSIVLPPASSSSNTLCTSNPTGSGNEENLSSGTDADREAGAGHTVKTRNWLERSVDVHRLSRAGGGSAPQERSLGS